MRRQKFADHLVDTFENRNWITFFVWMFTDRLLLIPYAVQQQNENAERISSVMVSWFLPLKSKLNGSSFVEIGSGKTSLDVAQNYRHLTVVAILVTGNCCVHETTWYTAGSNICLLVPFLVLRLAPNSVHGLPFAGRELNSRVTLCWFCRRTGADKPVHLPLVSQRTESSCLRALCQVRGNIEIGLAVLKCNETNLQLCAL